MFALEACNPQPEITGEPHPLRPNPGEDCTDVVQPEAHLTCGTDLVAVKTMELPRGGAGCSPTVADPGQHVTCSRDVTVTVPISIGLSDLELPIAGVASNTAVSDTASDPQKLGNYTSWYLQGVFEQADQEPLDQRLSLTSGGGGVSGAFTPPDLTKPLKLMALGDSITAGWYPCKLRDLLPSNIEMVGDHDQVFCPGLKTEGHGAFRTDMILNGYAGGGGLDSFAGIEKAMDAQNPNIVLVHLGTNDVGESWISIETIVQNLQAIVDKIHEHNSSTAVYVAKIITSARNWYAGSPEKIAQLNSAIGDPNTGIKNAYIVDLGNVLSPPGDFMSNDAVHPNESGGQKIANIFWSAIQQSTSDSSTGTTNASGSTSSPTTVDDVLLFSGPIKKLIPKEVLDKKRNDMIDAALAGTTYNQIIGYVKDGAVIGRKAALTSFAEDPARTDIERVRLTHMNDHRNPPYVPGDRWYTLWKQTPFVQTVDLPGEVFSTLSQADPGITNASLSLTGTVDQFRVSFPHLAEVDQLSQLLQAVFKPLDASETGGYVEPNKVDYTKVNRTTPYNTNYCAEPYTVWNPGDNLESKQTISGTFTFTKHVEYSFNEWTIAERIGFLTRGEPIPTTVDVDVSGPVSVFARNPIEMDAIYDRLLNPNAQASVYSAVLPFEDPGTDAKAAAQLSMDCGDNCEVRPANIAGKKAELFFPHWGQIFLSFHQKLQQALSPVLGASTAAGPTGTTSSSPYATMDIDEALAAAALRHRVPLSLLQAIYAIEGTEWEAWHQCAPSNKGALGPMQFTEEAVRVVTTDQEFGQFNRCNPGDAAELAARLLKYKVGQYLPGDDPGAGHIDDGDIPTIVSAAYGYYGQCDPDANTQRFWGTGIGYCDYVIYLMHLCPALSSDCDRGLKDGQ